MPAARKAKLAAGRGAERTMKRLPSCSISVSVSESRSAMISGQEPDRPNAAMRSSSAFFSTRARKLQNTWPRMVSSSLWKFERVEIGVGAQHEDAVEPFLLLDLIGVDREVILADRLQVASITGVADQRFVALCELPLQCGYDRSAIGGILRRLL